MQTMIPPAHPQQSQLQPAYEITEDDKKRQKLIRGAWIAYNGELVPPVKKMPDGTDPNVMSNRCGPIVERGVDFLFGKEIEITIAEDGPKEAQTLLDAVWARKERRLPLLQKLAMNGAMAGQAFLRIVPGRKNTFRLIIIDPATVFPETAPQDCETVLLYCIEYCTHEKQNDKDVEVYYREEIARIDPDRDGDDGDPFADIDATWSIQHWTRVGERGRWIAAGSPIIWPYNFPPVFSCQNLPNPNDFWGKPDITPDLIGVNKALNLTQTDINIDNILYSRPILYASGTGRQDFDVSPGRITGFELPESKIAAVPIAADIANALAFAANLRSDIDEQSSVPGVATGRITAMPRGNLSGIAIELLFQPLLKKTEKKRCLYGDLIINVSKALFVLSGLSEDIDVTIAWQYPLPSDDLPSIQAAVLKQTIGISDTSIQRELGYDPAEEAELSRKEDAQKLADGAQGQPVMPGQQQPPPGVPNAQSATNPGGDFLGAHG
jgi:hypothetical protein